MLKNEMEKCLLKMLEILVLFVMFLGMKTNNDTQLLKDPFKISNLRNHL